MLKSYVTVHSNSITQISPLIFKPLRSWSQSLHSKTSPITHNYWKPSVGNYPSKTPVPRAGRGRGGFVLSRWSNNEYCRDTTGRSPDNTVMLMVKQGHETPNFRASFAGWDFRRLKPAQSEISMGLRAVTARVVALKISGTAILLIWYSLIDCYSCWFCRRSLLLGAIPRDTSSQLAAKHTLLLVLLLPLVSNIGIVSILITE